MFYANLNESIILVWVVFDVIQAQAAGWKPPLILQQGQRPLVTLSDLFIHVVVVQYICSSNLVQYICSSMCYNTLHNTSVLCSSTLHALGPGLEGGLPKQLPAKPSSDNHRVEGKYELLLLLSSLMLDPPLKYQFVPIAPYTGCAQWPSTGKVPAHRVELCPFHHRS